MEEEVENIRMVNVFQSLFKIEMFQETKNNGSKK